MGGKGRAEGRAVEKVIGDGKGAVHGKGGRAKCAVRRKSNKEIIWRVGKRHVSVGERFKVGRKSKQAL